MYWHKICTDLATAIATIMVGVATFAVTRPILSGHSKFAIAVLFLFLVAGHLALAIYATKIIEQIRLILQKLDTFDGLFDEGVFLAKDSIYPATWAASKDKISMRSLPFATSGFLIVIGLLTTFFLGVI